MKIIKAYTSALIWLTALFLTACSEQFEAELQHPGPGTRVTAVFPGFGTDSTSNDTSHPTLVGDIQACLFDNGVMTQIFTDLTASAEGYSLNVKNTSGTLYMLANTAGTIDLQKMMEDGISEQQWLNTTTSLADRNVTRYITGSVKLESRKEEANPLPLTLKRGVARLDVHLGGTNIQVNSISLQRIKQKGFLFEHDPAQSPEEAQDTTVTISFSKPLQHDSLAVAYLLEQATPDASVAVQASIDGKAYQMEAKLPYTIKRNSVYTLSVQKDHTTNKLSLLIKEWQDGGETELVPDFDSKLTIDTEHSNLPQGAIVADTKDILTLPYTAADFQLSVDADEQLECNFEGNAEMQIEKIETGETRNIFRISKRLQAPGTQMDTITVYFHRTSLQHSYPEDHIKIVCLPNPIRLEGKLKFSADSYTCDFKQYIDNELGRLTLPQELELTAECPQNDPWIKLEQTADDNQTYRVIAGWKPNDPNADGREQSATLIVRRKSDGAETERYTVKRRNWGLPVTLLNGIWWCKYNAIGNSRRFEDQINCAQDPARLSGKSVRDYLKDCPQESFIHLWNSAYEGADSIALEAVWKDGKWTLDRWRQNESVHINALAATALSPEGYEMPSFDDYKRILGYPMTIPFTWTDYNPNNGGAAYRSSIIWETRSEMMKDNISLGTLAFFSIKSIKGYGSEELTFYGIGSQWGNDGINANNFLIANCNPADRQGSFINGSRRLTINGAGGNNTRLVRFKKSDVEYIYGTGTR